jgi:hypothetical protein
MTLVSDKIVIVFLTSGRNNEFRNFALQEYLPFTVS